MRTFCWVFTIGIAVLPTSAVVARSPGIANDDLRAPAAFSSIANQRARSVALFEEMGKVIQSPRCLNCHPRSDTPTQTDAMTVHQPMVTRGTTGQGAPGLACRACHHEANFDPAGVPGAPKWGLAPREMAWAGKSLGEICRQIKDPRRNGGKSGAELVEHFAHDPLVGWGWRPGSGRRPAPGSQTAMGVLAQAWVDGGAYCPA